VNALLFDGGPLLLDGPLFIGILNFSVSPMAIREASFDQLWTFHVG
jgi:hypothetical protein